MTRFKGTGLRATTSARVGFGLLVVLLSAGPFGPPHTFAQQKPASIYRDAIREGRIAAEALRDEAHIPGLSVAVGIDGKIVWSEGFGFADLETQTPVTTQTRFRLGSVSKMLTADAVAKLYEEGKLDLDAPIQRYAPSFPDKGHPITARQLAGHLGGIRHYQSKDYMGRNIDFEHFATVQDSLKVFQDDPMVSVPGAAYKYSTFGYTLLSRVVEGASGQTFLAYLHDHITEPLGMKQTCPDEPTPIIPHRTGFYDQAKDDRVVNAAFVDPSYKWAGGGILSTAEDLVRFGFAHLHPGFFKAETLDMMFTSQRTTDGKETGVGIGWRIATDKEGRRLVHHAGSMNGCRAVIVINRDTGLVVALLSNLGQTPADVERTALTLAEPFLETRSRRKSKARPELAGNYDYAIDQKGGPYSGTIEITRGAGYEEGWMTASTPLKAVAKVSGEGAVTRVRITGIVSEGEEARGVMATRYGVYPMRLRFENGELIAEVWVKINSVAPDLTIRARKRSRR
jgi:serine beta-lactamase-like protein LACTB, mitochondrial